MKHGKKDYMLKHLKVQNRRMYRTGCSPCLNKQPGTQGLVRKSLLISEHSREIQGLTAGNAPRSWCHAPRHFKIALDTVSELTLKP